MSVEDTRPVHLRYTRGDDAGLAMCRRLAPPGTVVDDVRPWSGRWWFDLVLVWLTVFGVWPLLDPGHGWDTTASILDGLVHYCAIGWLVARWRLERR